jgi:hypothetical protein
LASGGHNRRASVKLDLDRDRAIDRLTTLAPPGTGII